MHRHDSGIVCEHGILQTLNSGACVLDDVGSSEHRPMLPLPQPRRRLDPDTATADDCSDAGSRSTPPTVAYTSRTGASGMPRAGVAAAATPRNVLAARWPSSQAPGRSLPRNSQRSLLIYSGGMQRLGACNFISVFPPE